MARQTVPTYNPLESIVLDRNSPVPLYFQLAQHFENEIHSGNLDSGTVWRTKSRLPRIWDSHARP